KKEIDFSVGRTSLPLVHRIVVKIGTHSLASKLGRPNRQNLERFVAQIAKLNKIGIEVVLVSSGAVGMGLDALKIKTKPKTLAQMQMAAAVGQSRLMHTYQELFAKHKLLVAQVLLTQDDFHNRGRNLNARATIRGLLENGVVPIVNENDAVSVDEIQFGDNDYLAAHLAMLVDADLLILLTTVNGLQDRSGARAKRVGVIEDINDRIRECSSSDRGVLSSGGMKTKLEAANLASSNGIAVVIADGRKKNSLCPIVEGEDIGSLVLPKKSSVKGARRQWLAYSRRPKGDVLIDDGAVRALIKGKKSLLAVGVIEVEGSFIAGDLIRVCSANGEAIAKGLVNYSAEEVSRLRGCTTAEITKRIGPRQI
ncbi:UNVERIFIED_CONTAM: hypothetical protein GTU68_003683, partial [Idotea baltica]|nr:hypothetical protein [Idotea baltica]